MSEDYVNQVTLNFLISKSQLDKLNKKRSAEREETIKNDKEIFREQIGNLFNDLLNNNEPLDLLSEVRESFEYFVAKSIYFFKTRSEIRAVELEESEDKGIQEDDVYDDDKEDEDDVNDEDINNEDINDEEDFDIDKKPVHKKESKQIKLKESEQVHKLPLDWFKNTRQNYKMTQILPRKKEVNLDSGQEKEQQEEKKYIKTIKL